MEDQFFKYPEARICQLEEEVMREKSRRMEVEKELSELKDRCRVNRDVSNSVHEVNKTCLKTAQQVQEQIVPLQAKVMRLKKAIFDMNIKIGCSTDEANYYMLTEAQEWDSMAESVTNILRKGHAGRNQEGNSSKADKEWVEEEIALNDNYNWTY